MWHMLTKGKLKKPPTISQLLKKADQLHSIQVRTRGSKDEVNQCYTCKKWFPIKKLHCGHYLSRFYKSARWDDDNTRPQCMMCNLWKRGDPIVFRKNLVADLGIERVEAVETKRNMVIKLSRSYLSELIESYTHPVNT
jgi:hypothetical protein